jgi:hypothetical protein
VPKEIILNVEDFGKYLINILRAFLADSILLFFIE